MCVVIYWLEVSIVSVRVFETRGKVVGKVGRCLDLIIIFVEEVFKKEFIILDRVYYYLVCNIFG